MGLYETKEADYEYRKGIREAYNRGYEQGKADAKAEAIPVDWLMQKADWCDKNNGIFVSGAIRSAVDAWREEQKGN